VTPPPTATARVPTIPVPGVGRAFDTSVPMLIVKVGAYPLHHGGLHAVRTLGRVEVPVYALTEGPFTPVARSRYLAGAFVTRTTPDDPPSVLVEMLIQHARRIGRRTIPLATDDEAAVLLAEHRDELEEWFTMPAVAPGLPAKLASKLGLYQLTSVTGIPSPVTLAPSTLAQVMECANRLRFPIVVKNDAAWLRWTSPVVPSTQLVGGPDELLALAQTWTEPFNAVLQEYIPASGARDWIFHGYFDGDGSCKVGFTGVKHRSWPPGFGVTSFAETRPNPELHALSVRFAAQIGYRGIADMDWRYDPRDGTYNLLDFNPRVGANFGMFETDAHIDVVRAMHLDLTGRQIPDGQAQNGVRFVVGHLDPASRIASWIARTPPVPRGPRRNLRRAWMAADDPVPPMATALLTARMVATRLRAAARRCRPRPS
jgi:D-aspartate ligase